MQGKNQSGLSRVTMKLYVNHKLIKSYQFANREQIKNKMNELTRLHAKRGRVVYIDIIPYHKSTQIEPNERATEHNYQHAH